VTETTVQTDTLHALQILTERLVQEIGKLLTGLAILHIAVPVEHPCWDLELLRIVDDSHNLIDLICGELTCTLVQIDVTLLADDVRKSPANTTDGSQGKHDLLAPIDVCVTHTQNMLEILRLELYRHGASLLESTVGNCSSATLSQNGYGMVMGKNKQGGIYMASNVDDSTEIFSAVVEDPRMIGELGSCEHLRESLGTGTKLKAGEVCWFTDRTPHESLPLPVGTKRQFFRLVMSQVSVWYSEHSTANPLGIIPDPEVTRVLHGSKFKR